LAISAGVVFGLQIGMAIVVEYLHHVSGLVGAGNHHHSDWIVRGRRTVRADNRVRGDPPVLLDQLGHQFGCQ